MGGNDNRRVELERPAEQEDHRRNFIGIKFQLNSIPAQL